MTNATDVLLVGGDTYNGQVFCANLAKGPPASIKLHVDLDTVVEYVARKWWNINLQRWYWIATTADTPVADVTIVAALVAAQMQPAWDLKDLPAPSSDTTEES